MFHIRRALPPASVTLWPAPSLRPVPWLTPGRRGRHAWLEGFLPDEDPPPRVGLSTDYFGRRKIASVVARLSQILDTLESFYGPQTPQWPTDPYRFLVWWHCGYPASEERCSRGWESLNEAIGIAPEELLATPSSRLARALKSGGMIPELRAARLKQIAQRVQEEFDGDL